MWRTCVELPFVWLAQLLEAPTKGAYLALLRVIALILERYNRVLRDSQARLRGNQHADVML